MLLFKLLKRLRRRLQNKRALKALLDADEHLLRDIGITRDEIFQVHQLPLWKDPAVVVKRMTKERKLSVPEHLPPVYARRSWST